MSQKLLSTNKLSNKKMGAASAGSSVVTGDTLIVASGGGAGYYTVQLTDSNSCFTYDSILVTEPAEISITGTVTNVLCNGASTGALNTNATGGTTAYSYNWGGGDLVKFVSVDNGNSFHASDIPSLNIEERVLPESYVRML